MSVSDVIIRLSHGEPLLVQQLAVLAPDFQPPVTRLDGQPAVRAIAFGRVCLNLEHDGLPQRVSAIPAMHHRGIARGRDTREEDDRPRRRGLPHRIAAPAAAARREGAAQLRAGHGDAARRGRLASGDVSIVAPRRGRRRSRLFDGRGLVAAGSDAAAQASAQARGASRVDHGRNISSTAAPRTTAPIATRRMGESLGPEWERRVAPESAIGRA